MKPAERLAALEGLRGYAAFLVFLVHLAGYLGGRLYGLPAEVEAWWPLVHGAAQRSITWLAHSNYGVDLFFVLSGFLMADIAFGRWPGARRFLLRRWLRIYPAYAVSTMLAGLLAYFWLDLRWDAMALAGNVFLVHGLFVLGLVAANPVTWSLTYEMIFYLCVPMLARNARRRALHDARWIAALATAYALLLAIAIAIPHAKAVYLAYFALFLPGVWLGALDPPERQRLAAATPLALVAFAWIAFTLAFKLELLSNRSLLYYPMSSIACTLAVLKATDARGAFARVLASVPLRTFGRYSYSFFLIHFIVLQAWGALLWSHVTTQRGPYALLFIAGGFSLSLAAAWLLYVATERFYFREASRQPLAA
jgi:exopolysaccharide production protein ExoZ